MRNKVVVGMVAVLAIVLLLGTTQNALQLRRVADFYLDAAVGRIRDTSTVNKFGRNDDVDSAADEDVWDGGGVWSEPTASQVYTLTSTSTADTLAGTGARTVQVFGLNASNAEVNETINLAGTDPVTLSTSLTMIHRMVVTAAGSGGVNAGTITAVANTDATVTAQINVGNNQTLMAIYKIPADKQGCVLNYYSSLNKATGATVTDNILLKAKPTGEVFQIKEVIGHIKDGTSTLNRVYRAPNCFPSLTIIKITADVSANDVDVSAGFDMVLVPN